MPTDSRSTVRLEPVSNALISRAAARLNLSVNSYLSMAALDRARRELPPSEIEVIESEYGITPLQPQSPR